MFLVFNDRPSDSPFVERIWSAHSKGAGEFLSVAAGHCEMAVTRYRGQTFLTIRGPETIAQTPDRTDTGRDRAPDQAVVVLIQDNAPSARSTMRTGAGFDGIGVS